MQTNTIIFLGDSACANVACKGFFCDEFARGDVAPDTYVIKYTTFLYLRFVENNSDENNSELVFEIGLDCSEKRF